MKNFYDSVFAGHYDAIYADKDYLAECDLIEQVFEQHGENKIKSVLDLGCGTGIHSIELARRGYRVLGVDISAPMLTEAQHKAERMELAGAVSFECADICTWQPAQRHDAVLMMFSVLGYQDTNAAALRLLERVRQQLAPGGLLLLDIWFGPGVISQQPEQRTRRIPAGTGEIVRVSSARLEPMRQLCHISFDFEHIEDGRVVETATEHHTMRYFFPLELELLLSLAGFSLQRMGPLADFERTPDNTDRDVLCVAQVT